MKHATMVLLLCVQCEMYAAFEHLARGSGSIAMGGAAIAVSGNPWAAFSNPAGLSTFDERILSIYYSPQPFGLKELAHGSFSYTEPTAIGTFAASGSRYGFELYREVDLQISYGNDISDLLSAGATVHYYHLSIERYGSAQTFGVDVGLLAQLTEQIRWGFSAFNINVPTIGSAKEKLPQVFVTGIAYSPIPELTLAVDLEKDVRYPVELHAGIQYMFLDLLAARVGTTNDPSIFSAGLGIRYSFVQLDYAFANHSELGAMHQMSLSLYLGDL
jgi:hypothetical protein